MLVDRRTLSGTAVISSRRLHLGARLLNAGVGARILLPQTSSAGIQLPSLCPPLLLDTRDLGFVQSAALLVELATRRPVIPTIVLVDPDDVALRVILRVCPAIYAILADTEDLRLLGPLIRLGGLCGSERMNDVAPYWSGIPPVQRAPLSLEELEVLVALARAENIDDAVEYSGMARRTFYRRLARLRASLGLPPATHGVRIEELVNSMITALANFGQTTSDMPLPQV
jgi:hypothetical protein